MFDVLKLLTVLALIVFLLYRKWNLGLVLVLASLLLGLFYARPVDALARDALGAVTDWLTLRLAAIVILILTLGEILRRTARLDGMVHALEQLIPDTRIVLAVVPAFIGLLPMVGGAVFSAPMVDHLGDRLAAGSGRKTFVNYWFRHIWEYVFPLYPSFLLATTLLGLPEQQATATMWPLTVACALGGVLFGLLGIRRADRPRRREGTLVGLRELALSVWPIALVLILALAAGIDLIISLLIAILFLSLINRVGGRQLWDILLHAVRWDTVLVIFGAMVFRRVLDETGAVAVASRTLTEMDVPLVLVLFAVPFVAGLLSGLGTAAFAIGFPIVLPLIDQGQIAPELAMWAWAGGFLGVMMSPVHLCLALTRDYFDAEWGEVYRMIVPAVLLTAGTAGLYLFLEMSSG
jgi:integral membrane protein (TIGR00529 family)